MIEQILALMGGMCIGIYITSFAIYIKELVSDFKLFKPTRFFEYAIILLMVIGSIVPILNSICAYRITIYRKNK